MNAAKLTILFFTLLLSHSLSAQWNYSPSQNSIVDTGLQKRSTNPEMISDGNGGYFITWMKSKTGTYGTEIFAQRISANGTRLWSDTGKLICDAALNQFWPKIISDGAGGVIITWQDSRLGFSNWDIYAQRVNASGAILWANNGVPVFDVLNADEYGPEIVSDNNGGAIIGCWRSSPIGASVDIYAQRISPSGAKLWAPAGTIICNAIFEQSVPKITTDGAGGAILCWRDFRGSTPTTISDIYAQRVNSSGAVMWANNGMPISIQPYDQSAPQISADNNGGAYIVWEDFRTSSPTQTTIDIYAQHINSAGSPLWTVNGIPVCGAVNNQQSPNLFTDESNGAIIAWHDSRIVLSSIYAQKVTAAGTMLWAANGVSVCANANNYLAAPLLTSDGSNGAFICWEDKRTGADRNIYAQHISSAGLPVWAIDGVPICNAPNDQLLNVLNSQITNGAVVKSGNGRAVIVWQDGRADPVNGNDDIYMSQIADLPNVVVSFINVSNKCQHAPTARGKVLNPPVTTDIIITQDGNPLVYFPADSSFEYFISGTTTPGTHTVRVRYSNFAGSLQKDSTYTVTATAVPAITVSGNTTVNQGQSTTLSTVISNGGPGPQLQWADSTSASGWTIIAGATNPSLVYTPAQTGVKVRSVLLSNANCANPNLAVSNAVEFTVNVVTSIDPVSRSAYGIRYYPNPARQTLIIDSLKLSDNWLTAEIVSMDGRKLRTIELRGSQRISIDLSGLPTGQYFVILRSKREAGVYMRVVHL